ncbi:MAG: GNAT family N-acetyltransferase [Clostridiales bacterium]|nr:GNAT family N-acetyltransferase [Clostridiales bacterium]
MIRYIVVEEEKMNIRIVAYDRDNWEEAQKLSVTKAQQELVPSVSESLAAAYIKPWDEALDPYILYDGDTMIGAFYNSYTPGSVDNYWIGGFFIDQKYQGKGFGKASLRKIIEFIQEAHPKCSQIWLTIVKGNLVARKLYESIGFKTDGSENAEGEVRYQLNLNI